MTRIFWPAPALWWRTLRTARATALLIASLAGAVACSDTSSTAPHNNGGGTGSVMGNYDLMQIDQAQLPQEIYHGPYFDEASHHFYNQLVVRVTGAIMELDELGQFFLNVDVAINADGNIHNDRGVWSGTYKVFGSNVDFQLDGDKNAYRSGSVTNGFLVLPLDLMHRGRQQTYRFQVLR